MWKGKVVAIHIASEEGGRPYPIETARLVEDRGIEGDRYCTRAEEKGLDDPGQQVTLIESEALDAIRRESELEIDGAESRRNILTSGVALNHLVDRTFRVGEAVLEGRELCEPCGFLERTTKAGVVKALMHRAGLRARIVRGGVVRAGDSIEEA